MKKAAVPSILVVVVLLALGVTAEAQQPTKIPRIGYLVQRRPKDSGASSRHSSKGCGSLGTWREKTLSLSNDMRRENSIGCLSSRLS